MISLLAGIVGAFTPLAFVTGLILASRRLSDSGKGSRSLIAGIGLGLFAAVALYVLTSRNQTPTAARVPLDSPAIVASPIHAPPLFLPENRRKSSQIRKGAAVFFLTALALSCMASFLNVLGDQGLTSVAVMNTELILNVGAVVLGACLIACLTPLMSNIAPKSGRRGVIGCLLAASVLIILPKCGEVLLGLMRLKAIEVAAGALSFVAKANKFGIAVSYVELAMAAGLSALFLLRRTVFTAGELSAMPSAQRRQTISVIQLEARWVRASAAFICAALSILLAHALCLVAKITRPVRLTPTRASSGQDRDVADGNLHRFVHNRRRPRRRFLLIKLTAPRGRASSGRHDACVMCGDKGYPAEARGDLPRLQRPSSIRPSEGGRLIDPTQARRRGEDIVVGRRTGKGREAFLPGGFDPRQGPPLAMFFSMTKQSFMRGRRRKALAVSTIVLAASLITALMNLSIGVGDKMAREMKSYGAKITIVPNSENITLEIDGVDYNPLKGRVFIEESDLAKIKEIFWHNNIIGFAPFLKVAVEIGGAGNEPIPLLGTRFDAALPLSEDEEFRVGVRPINPFWQVQGRWPEDGDAASVLAGAALARRLDLSVGSGIVSRCPADKERRVTVASSARAGRKSPPGGSAASCRISPVCKARCRRSA